MTSLIYETVTTCIVIEAVYEMHKCDMGGSNPPKGAGGAIQNH